MTFAEVVARRQMVRHYLDTDVPREALQRVLGRARRAPSAGFSQGVDYLVVTNHDTRASLAALAGEARYRARGFPPWLSSAPVHLLLTTSPSAYHQRYAQSDKAGGSRSWDVPYWYVDAGAALMVLLLAAVDEGLGAGFLGAHRLAGACELLGVPPQVSLVGLVTLGYAHPEQRPSGSLARGRRETVHWERWCGESTS